MQGKQEEHELLVMRRGQILCASYTVQIGKGEKITWKSKETGSKLGRADSRAERVFSWLNMRWLNGQVR